MNILFQEISNHGRTILRIQLEKLFIILQNMLKNYRYNNNRRNKFCNDEKRNGKLQNFVESAKLSSPTGRSGATNVPSIGISSMYTEIK